MATIEEPLGLTMARPALYGGEPIRCESLGYGGQDISEADKEAVLDALERDHITRGPMVEAFELAVAEFVGANHAVATTSGTTALHLAGSAVDFGPGDEVITTPLTFVATAYPACYTGATPVLADVEPEFRTLDPDAVRSAVSEQTVGLVPMHYGGHPCDIDAILDVADDHDLKVVWDACHAFGTRWRDEMIGAQRHISAFSFHPVKNLTTGEGGMVVTNDDELADRCRSLRSFDMDYDPPGHTDEPWYQITEGLGYNYNMTELQAALGLKQLERIDEFRRRRQDITTQYDNAFENVTGLRTPSVESDADPMFHLYAVEVSEPFGCSRGEFVRAMNAENIHVQVHYVPLNYHPYFQNQYGYEPGQFPMAETAYERLISLPLFPAMTDEDVRSVIKAVRRLHDHHI